MTETDLQTDVADAETVAAVVADICAVWHPQDEPAAEREQRLAEWQARDANARERRRVQQAKYEAELVAELDAEQAEQVRIEQARIEAVKRDLRERSSRQQRERQEHADRERIAAIENQMAAARARAEQAKREQQLRAHWQEFDELCAGLTRLVSPPPRDPTAERIAALEDELTAQAEIGAAEAERRRSQQYAARQAANIARRESRGW
jgi:hypothetical protein